MNENNLIKKLINLKRFAPRDSTMLSIKHQVLEKTGIISKPKKTAGFLRFISRLFLPKYQLAYALTFVLIIGFAFRPINPMTKATETVGIAVSSLQKANGQTQIFNQEKNLDRTQIELVGLNLNGEPGKYTKEQCRQIYYSYEAYLQDYKKHVENLMNLSGQNDAKKKKLYEKILQYQHEIETKWPTVE